MLSSPRPWYRKPWIRSYIYQIIAVVLLAGLLAFFITNLRTSGGNNTRALSLDFMFQPSGFEMGENFLSVTPDDANWKVFLAGFVNTLVVSLCAIVLCVVLGTAVAFARLSPRRWLADLGGLWVEINRNVPLLLHILFWYALCRAFPGPRQAELQWPGFFATNRGLILPEVSFAPGPVSALSVIAGMALWLAARRGMARAGWLRVGSVAAFLAALLGAFSWTQPELAGLRYKNASIITPEFLALFLSLGIYQSGFFAETVRSGIMGVGRGQHEAAASLGLSQARIMWLVIIPQALRIMIPPATSQFGGLIKNSSLGVLIAFPEIVRVSMATSVDTGRIIECTLVIMASFLAVNLVLSAGMNWLNRRAALVNN